MKLIYVENLAIILFQFAAFLLSWFFSSDSLSKIVKVSLRYFYIFLSSPSSSKSSNIEVVLVAINVGGTAILPYLTVFGPFSLYNYFYAFSSYSLNL